MAPKEDLQVRTKSSGKSSEAVKALWMRIAVIALLSQQRMSQTPLYKINSSGAVHFVKNNKNHFT